MTEWKDFFTPLCVIVAPGRVHLSAMRGVINMSARVSHDSQLCMQWQKAECVCHQSILSPHSEPHIFLLLHESRAELPGCGRDEEDPGARSTNDAVCFLFTLNVTKTRFSSCLLLNMNYSATLSSNCEELKLNVQSWSFSFMLWTWMLTWILPAAHRQTCIGSQPGHLTETW